MTHSESTCLLVGYGQLGQALAEKIVTHHRVYAIQRSQADAFEQGVQRLQADLQNPATLRSKLPTHIDYVVVALSPGGRTEAAYRAIFLDGVKNLLESLAAYDGIKRLIFVSSTSVYHQNDGSWVDEESPTQPKTFSGNVLLTAEDLIRRSGLPATIVRFSGIYGGQRHRLLKSIITGRTSPSLTPTLSNRIHEMDCVGILAHLLECASRGQSLAPLYLASDDRPVSLNEVVHFIREELGLPFLAPSQQPDPPRRGGNKRCSNARIKSTGYRFEYPDFEAGYREQILRHRALIDGWLHAAS